MTSTTDTAGHPEVTEISDLTEGLLPPSRTADVRRHLDGCPLCADVYASLEEIRGLLGTLPGPSRMPADVAGRIDAALAAEALLSATTTDLQDADVRAATSADGSPAVPDDGDADTEQGASEDGHVSRETSTSAAGGRPTGHSRAATGPGRTPRTRRSRRGTIALGAFFTVAALGLGTFLVQSVTEDNPGDTPSTAEQQHTDAAHTFSKGKLQQQVADLLAARKGPDSGNKRSAEPDFGATGSSDGGPHILKVPVVPVPDCIQKGINRTEEALATSKGVYNGTKVYLVVLPDPSDSTQVTAYIVDATCVGQAKGSSGKVLLEQSYASS
ncbi:anti-sigma factor family protein [Streptomyces sp. NPDC058274]|uniref:anti-sigma factor family protein n=1 Tax=Streptomyces sp. NPDC058274 TaxID=3346416 RepID=UPI0036E89A0D